MIGGLQNGRDNPRPGLRRWVLGRVFAEPNDLHDRAYVELHHDGTVLVAGMNLGGLQPLDGKNTISDYGVHSVVVDLVSLVSVLTEKRGLTGSTLVRFDLLRSNDRPFGLITPERIGNEMLLGHRQASWSRDVRTFIPVETTLPPLRDMLSCRRTAYGIAADVLAQFGLMPKDIGWQEPRDG